MQATTQSTQSSQAHTDTMHHQPQHSSMQVHQQQQQHQQQHQPLGLASTQHTRIRTRRNHHRHSHNRRSTRTTRHKKTRISKRIQNKNPLSFFYFLINSDYNLDDAIHIRWHSNNGLAFPFNSPKNCALAKKKRRGLL